MPDFRAAFTSGVTLEPWADPADSTRPTRQNIIADRGHTRRQGTVGSEIELTATVDGVAGPLDAALDDRLFLVSFAEWVEPKPALSSPVGQSSVQRFTPASAGHYCFAFRRDGGGGIFMHVDVVGT